ncbi:coiled-coil domain-containing protein 158-like isoform X2 [Papaver somniferum]|uniref:coiled-coil domain-containing protein 158-like isoform X2 n=1 Tax=Papaver somniferum TaxID=3469 RepID=UPI000E703C98|nr:coiled-coil domain-containing protein 158-like isoform X2 [Papaver somniferum]
MATTRRIRWYPPPPPSPRILHLPLRRPVRRKTSSKNHLNPKIVVPKESPELLSHQSNHPRGKLETLFDQERVFSKTVPIVLLNSSPSVGHHYGGDGNGRRERVEEDFEFGHKCEEPEDINENEKWRFQAEILRAECNFLRMEREIALRKLEINRVQTQKTLRSAGKKKIYQGKNVDSVLEEEIDELEEKLNDLHRKSGVTDIEIRKCDNFDLKASVLQRRLEKLEFDDKYVKEIQQLAESSLTIKPNNNNHRFTDVEILGKKMEGISKGMLEKMEAEYRSMLSSTATSSATVSGTSSASTSSRYEFPHNSFSSSKKDYQYHQRRERTVPEEKVCAGRCKMIVRKIVEQVRSEMEQWSQMQDMLGRVRVEMEELQASRDYWEDRALNSNNQVQSLESSVQDWREKAHVNETKVSELQKQISELQVKLKRSRTERNQNSSRIKNLEMTQGGDLSQKEKEKRVLICSLKENPKANLSKQTIKHQYSDVGRTKECPTHSGNTGSNRSPLSEIKNSSSPKSRQIGRTTLMSPSYSTEKHHRANCSKQNRDNFGFGRKHDGAYHNGSIRTPLEEVGNLASPKFRQKRRESYPFVLV